jgi:hypothetical protein
VLNDPPLPDPPLNGSWWSDLKSDHPKLTLNMAKGSFKEGGLLSTHPT